MTSSLRIRPLLSAALFALAASGVLAQAPAAADHVVPWTLFPPVAGVPCPSHETRLDAPAALVKGEFPLSKAKPPVVDGDTLRVDGLDGSIRFIGLDCEETFKDRGKARLAATNWDEYVKTETAGHDPRRPPKYATPMGMAAKSGLEALVAGVETVRIEYDDVDRMKDGFGRHLCFVLVRRGETWINLNVEIVRQGLSPYFVKYGRSRRRHEAFLKAEAEAREGKRGIWGPETPIRRYADYPARLAWWQERDEADAAARAARARSEDVVLLGRADEWERLKAMKEGRVVTVVSTFAAYRDAGKKGLLGLAHVDRKDFLVVAEEADRKALAELPKAYEGDLVFVTGRLAFYKGEPQFLHSTAAPVRISRRPPGLPESAPTSR